MLSLPISLKCHFFLIFPFLQPLKKEDTEILYQEVASTYTNNKMHTKHTFTRLLLNLPRFNNGYERV